MQTGRRLRRLRGFALPASLGKQSQRGCFALAPQSALASYCFAKPARGRGWGGMARANQHWSAKQARGCIREMLKKYTNLKSPKSKRLKGGN